MCRDYILIGNFLVMAFLPFSLLSTLNYLLYRTIKQSGQLYMPPSPNTSGFEGPVVFWPGP